MTGNRFTPAPYSGSASGASISSDGNRVAFASSSPSLVANDTNGVADVFVRTLSDGQIIGPNAPFATADDWSMFR